MSPFHETPGDLALDWVRTLAPYVPGKPIAELERELRITNIIKLASNENPFGPSPLALEAMQRALADTWLYPDGSGHVLKHKLAQQLGVEPSQITLGNGSNDALGRLAQAVNAPTRIVFVANPNNPTGTWVGARELEAFIAAMPRHVIVALDEAYFEYRGDLPLQNGIEW